MPPAPDSLDRNVDRTAVSRPGAVSILPGGVISSPRRSDEDHDGDHDDEAPTTSTTNGTSPSSSRGDILVNAKLVTSERDIEQGGVAASVVPVPTPFLVKAETLSEFPPGAQELGLKELLQKLLQHRWVKVLIVIFVVGFAALIAYVVVE
jgi:hypothetical protein